MRQRPSNCPPHLAVTGQPAQLMYKYDLLSKDQDHRNNWFHGLGTPQRCCHQSGPIAMAWCVSLSQWEVAESFGREKIS